MNTWKFLRNFLFLFVLVMMLGGIVWHYSRFSTGRKFLLETIDAGIISDHQEEMEYVRLLVRNRYPFELSVTVRLCSMDGDTTAPRFSIIDKQHYSFTGTRSLYSGTYETRVSIVASGEGRFYVVDRSDKPGELFDLLTNSSQNREEVDEELRTTLTGKVREGQLSGVSTIREDQMTINGKEIIKYCSLPGEHPDKILVITLTPRAKYGR